LDLAVWRATFSSTVFPGIAADGNADGTVDAADFIIWRKETSNALAAGVLFADAEFPSQPSPEYATVVGEPNLNTEPSRLAAALEQTSRTPPSSRNVEQVQVALPLPLTPRKSPREIVAAPIADHNTQRAIDIVLAHWSAGTRPSIGRSRDIFSNDSDALEELEHLEIASNREHLGCNLISLLF